MTAATNELGAILLRRFLDRPEERAMIINRIVDHAADRLGALDRDRRRHRHIPSAAVFAVGFAAGAVTLGIAIKRSPLGRRLAAQLREDKAVHTQRVAGYDDAELAHKVESVVFRHDDLPKGKVSINAENGTVFLRGQVDSPDTIVRIERAVREVEGVDGVENLLHLPGTPAPHPHGGALIQE
jgi:hypothetical protein